MGCLQAPAQFRLPPGSRDLPNRSQLLEGRRDLGAWRRRYASTVRRDGAERQTFIDWKVCGN
jgi:hypothetical protein